MKNSELYFAKRDTFYYVEIVDKVTSRDNKISELFGIEPVKRFHSNYNKVPTSKIYLAKFWKDEFSAIRSCNYETGTKALVRKISQEQFVQIIPDFNEISDTLEKEDHNYLRNLKLKKTESSYLRKWSVERKKYKATSSYKKVSNPQYWFHCKNCGLIPLVWEFDNGRFTACGCGENEYKNLSIRAESIMSYVQRHDGSALGFDSDELRFNWNHWVKTGQDLFTERKKLSEIW